jgi:hypothetical protein
MLGLRWIELNKGHTEQRFGGGRGIRTPGGLAAPAVFKLGRVMSAGGWGLSAEFGPHEAPSWRDR